MTCALPAEMALGARTETVRKLWRRCWCDENHPNAVADIDFVGVGGLRGDAQWAGDPSRGTDVCAEHGAEFHEVLTDTVANAAAERSLVVILKTIGAGIGP